MTKTYQVKITTQYRGSENIYVEAKTAAQAIKDTRKKVTREMWFDKRNDGRVTYSATNDY